MRRGLATAVMLLAMASCVSALGVDDERKSAVTAVCQCVSDGSVFSDFDDCVRTLNIRLDSSSSGTRAAWLKNFTNKQCHDCVAAGDVKAECLDQEPTCGRVGDPCDRLPCCTGKTTCGDGKTCK